VKLTPNAWNMTFFRTNPVFDRLNQLSDNNLNKPVSEAFCNRICLFEALEGP